MTNVPVLLLIAAVAAVPSGVFAQAKAASPESSRPPVTAPTVAYVVRPTDRYNPVERIALDKSRQPASRVAMNIGCARVYAAGNGELVCLTNSLPGSPGKFTPLTTYVFSASMQKLAAFERPISGIPSRARFSADGKYAATTVFTSGHSYLGVAGSQFSTETVITHRADGATAQDIQKWPITHKGIRVTSVDLNLWGVTFDARQSDRFFVTAYFNGTPYLAEGSVSGRSIKVLHPNVECPSLSPDGKRIAFKRRLDATTWAPAILELATLKEQVLSVPNSVDDQIEWMDDQTIVYEVAKTPLLGAVRHDIYAVDLSVKVPVQALWLEDARSPTFVREIP